MASKNNKQQVLELFHAQARIESHNIRNIKATFEGLDLTEVTSADRAAIIEDWRKIRNAYWSLEKFMQQSFFNVTKEEKHSVYGVGSQD